MDPIPGERAQIVARLQGRQACAKVHVPTVAPCSATIRQLCWLDAIFDDEDAPQTSFLAAPWRWHWRKLPHLASKLAAGGERRDFCAVATPLLTIPSEQERPMKEGSSLMKTGLNTALDPTKRSHDAQDFDNALRRKIVGQDAAIEKVTEIYQMFLAGLNPPNRPIGNLLFLGPTGSGKTRVVEAMGESLYGDARACIKIDCAEFQHSHEIAKLIGSPPGSLGHRG